MILSHPRAVETSPAYGLFPASDFFLTTGAGAQGQNRENYPLIAQALWYFRDEVIALPHPAHPVAGFDPARRADDDVRRWNARTPAGEVRDYPALVWVGSTQVIEHARLDAGAEYVLTATGRTDFSLAPRLASNRSYYNGASTAFFTQRELRVRGEFAAPAVGQPAAPRHIIARCIWPEDFRLDPLAPFKPLAGALEAPDALREFLRAQPTGAARDSFAAQVIWQRHPDAARQRAGRPVIGLMLNGAQADDDEAHGGHFGLLTGRVGAQGEMHDWLMANYYTLATESEKGIIAAMLPLDTYLADLNSGQAWYRPSCMLVATLRDERAAKHLSSALSRVFNSFYRDPSAYQHAVANCAGISVSTLRAMGWNVPKLGVTSWWKALAALPVVALSSRSLSKGKAMFDYLTEERTRLFPAVAFEQIGSDLLQLLGGKISRALTPYETLLKQDVEEILLLRIPQFPSSRARGMHPVSELDEYRRRVPRNPDEQQIIPVDARHLPPTLRDPALPKAPPLRSDFAVAGYTAAALLLGGWALRGLLRRRRANPAAQAKARDE